MKQIHLLLGAAVGSLFLATPMTQAQVVESTSTTTTSVGTLSEFGPDAIVIRTEAAPEPLRYRFTKTTTYVDESGAPIERALLKPGLPITIHYAETDNGLVASKVVVKKTSTAPGAPISKETTTTTRTMGTLSEFGPDMIVVRSETSAEPLRYSYSKTTTYVDETGAPVSREMIKAGLPVTVHYTRTGDRMVASKVIVRKSTTPAPAVESREERTTTTTTTTPPK